MLLLLLFKLVISVILFLLSFELLEDDVVVESFLSLFITDVDAVEESVLENELFDSVVQLSNLQFHEKKSKIVVRFFFNNKHEFSRKKLTPKMTSSFQVQTNSLKPLLWFHQIHYQSKRTRVDHLHWE